jgi:isocitrate/isopropylmalate dehydrogenase
MLDVLGLHDEAGAVEAAVRETIAANRGTQDIGGGLGTRETGDCIVELISDRAARGGRGH